MATVEEFETLDDEVRELIQNYKHKRATAYEPCTLNNIKECLIGLSEVSYSSMSEIINLSIKIFIMSTCTLFLGVWATQYQLHF